MDAKRAKALGFVSNLTNEELNNTKFRMAENRNVILWVRGSLEERGRPTGSRWSAW